jgi:hypothetical protein
MEVSGYFGCEELASSVAAESVLMLAAARMKVRSGVFIVLL